MIKMSDKTHNIFVNAIWSVVSSMHQGYINQAGAEIILRYIGTAFIENKLNRVTSRLVPLISRER